MNFIWDWLGKHWSSVSMALLLSWLTIGGSYLFFFRPTTNINVANGGRYVSASDGLQPTFGCATGRQFFGWAHSKDKK